jgi:hypothetical protein
MCRRIEAVEPRRLHAIAIGQTTGSSFEVLKRRKSFHNVIAYQRRRSVWWKSVGLWLWWNGNSFNGVVALGSVTTKEFSSAFRDQGPVAFRPIEAVGVRVEIYQAALVHRPLRSAVQRRRYQSLSVAISLATNVIDRASVVDSAAVEAMPILL